MVKIDLNPDAPHNPDRTRELANTAADVMRCLNYATVPGKGGLLYPGDVYGLLGTLAELVGRVPQLVDQTRHFLLKEQAADHLEEDEDGPNGGAATLAVLRASDALSVASGKAAELGKLLDQAQSTIRSVRYAEAHR